MNKRKRLVQCVGCSGQYFIDAKQCRLKSYEHCPYCDCNRFRAIPAKNNQLVQR